MTKPICYAIMPYGGKDENLQNHFAEVFQLYIKTPAETCGYEVIREDYDGRTGPIPTSIIKHIAESDLVIADVSTVGDLRQPNFNVAYELGIRHAMVKRGTILIRNADDRESAFDIRQIKTIKYGKTLLTTQNEIVTAISKLQSQSEADNEVHGTYPDFGDRMVDYLHGGDVRLNALQEENTRLRSENIRFQEKLKNLGISSGEDESDDIDIGKSIDSAMKSIQYSGKKLLVTLQQELNCSEPNYEEIAFNLEKGLTIGQLSESDFRRLRSMFSNSELPQLTSLILEVAAKRYPASLDFKSYLADVYSDSYETWDKALKYANEVLQVKCDENGHYHTSCHQIDWDQLAACFNAYIGISRYDIIIAVGTELLHLLPNQRELILRNLQIAYRFTNQHDEEYKTLLRLIQDYPMSDINHYCVAQYYLRKENFIQAYYHSELASALDTEDADYLFSIAGLILDRRIARTKGKVRSNLSREESVALSVPFVFHAFENAHSPITYQRCQDFLLRNHLHVYANAFNDWKSNGSASQELNFEALDYIRELSTGLTEESCSQIEL